MWYIKGNCFFNTAAHRGAIQASCYPMTSKTNCTTMVFKKCCITTRTIFWKDLVDSSVYKVFCFFYWQKDAGRASFRIRTLHTLHLHHERMKAAQRETESMRNMHNKFSATKYRSRYLVLKPDNFIDEIEKSVDLKSSGMLS